MELKVVICDSRMVPVTAPVYLQDHAGFAAIERQAADVAMMVGRCCIRWENEAGQVAFWGPKRATTTPQWYAHAKAARGRPLKENRGRIGSAYLPDELWEKAAKIGGGNASEGIRIALSIFAED